jgi:hypothetical protein
MPNISSPYEAGKAIVRYSGSLVNGTVFDMSPEGLPYVVAIGNVKANKGPVEGWSFALRGMCEGEDRTFSVEPSRGYGSKGWHNVPPNATLFYHVSMVKKLTVRKSDISGATLHGHRTMPKVKHNYGHHEETAYHLGPTSASSTKSAPFSSLARKEKEQLKARRFERKRRSQTANGQVRRAHRRKKNGSEGGGN